MIILFDNSVLFFNIFYEIQIDHFRFNSKIFILQNYNHFLVGSAIRVKN